MAGARDFPGLELSERPMAPGEEEGFGVQPKNPNVGQPSDPGTQFRNARFGNQGPMPQAGAAPAPGAAPVAAQPAPSAVGGVRNVLGTIGRGLGRLTGGAGAIYSANEMDKSLASDDSASAAGHAVDTAAGMGMALGAPATAALGTAWMTGRGIGTAIHNALPENVNDTIGGIVNQAGLRTGMWGTNDDAMLADKAALHTGVVSLVTGGTAPTAGMAPQGGGNPTDARLADGSQLAPGSSDVTFGGQQGAPVAGADGVRKFVDSTGRMMYSNVSGDNKDIMPGSNIVNVMPGMSKEAIQAANNLPSSNGSTDYLHDGALSAPGMGVIGGDSFERAKAARNAEFENANLTRGMSARQAGAFLNERRGQDKQAETQRDITGRTVGATLRGQDLSHEAQMYGHQITGMNARARLGYEMGKDARDFGLRATEFQAGRGDKAYEQQRQGEEQLQKNLESRFRTTDEKGNSVPDHAKVAEYRTSMDSTIPALAKQLRATGTQEGIAKAADLEKRGPAALQPADHDRLQQLFDTRARMIASRGMGPNQGTATYSPNLLDYSQLPGAAGVERRTFGGNRVVTKAGSVSSKDLQYADAPANALFPDMPWKQQSTTLTRGLRTE